MSGKHPKKIAQGKIKKAAKASKVIDTFEGDYDDGGTDEVLTAEQKKTLKKWKTISEADFIREFVDGWASCNVEQALALLTYCGTALKARAVIEACPHGDWVKFLKPWCDKNSDFDLEDKEAITNKLLDLKAGEKNKEIGAQQQLLQSLLVYDTGQHKPPGQLLTNALEEELVGDDFDWGTDWARIRKISKGLADLMLIEDAAYEAADWELRENKAKTATLPDYVAFRKERKSQAEKAMVTLVGDFLEQRRIFEIEENKNANLDTIRLTVNATVGPLIASDALCVAVWQCALANIGKSGYFELSVGYDAPAIKKAWTTWKKVQDHFRAHAVPGFATRRLGKTGEAQDKTGHSDFASRSHTFQKNFSVTWKGVEQMIHVGLLGTEK